MNNNQMARWETICSDLKDLQFHDLHDLGMKLRFSIKDKNFIYTFIFEKLGPYQLADEGFLSDKYIYDGKSGATRIIENSDWKNSFSQGYVEFYFAHENPKVYMIATADACLEIFAGKEPEIHKEPIN